MDPAVIHASLTINPDQSLNEYYLNLNLTSTQDVFFTLSDLKRDLDLYVTKILPDGSRPLFPNGKVANIANSTNDGLDEESIFLRLKPGQYHAYVRENNGANDSFGPLRSPEDYTFTLKLDSTSFKLSTNLPNDPFLDYQWYLFNTGVLNDNLVKIDSLFNGTIATPNVDIVAPEAWRLRNDGAQAILAIIDQGVDLEHPDLVGNLWTNLDEIAGNGIDDDRNGFVDDIHGWNFADNISTPKKGKHGTHVAGIAAASGNNSIGISGVAWNAKIMSLDVFPAQGSADDNVIIPAIYYAVNNGAKVINLSLGSVFKVKPGSSLPKTMQEYAKAFQYAKENDVFIAVAAGNSGTLLDDLTDWQKVGDLDRYLDQPASLNRFFSNVATVIATESTNQKAGYSSFGRSTSIAAPGGDTSKEVDIYIPDPGEVGDPITARVNFGILSTVPVGTGNSAFGGNYDFLQGTSMASPVIAGMATLIRSANPSISAQDTLAILRAGASSYPSLQDFVNRGLSANLYESLKIAENWNGPGDLLKLKQTDLTPVLNLSFLTNGALTVQGTVTVARNASYDPITGFYKSIDAEGSVLDSTGNIVRPGDKRYAAIALHEGNIVSSISGVPFDGNQSTQISMNEAVFLAPFAKVEGHTWFAYKEANSDGLAHFKLLGTNTFGLEDMYGGGDLDYNDHIISFAVDTLA
jgi:subtilisin family serine protease